MNQSLKHSYNGLTPLTLTGLKLDSLPTEAVGVKAITNSIKHVFGKMSVHRGLKALLGLNQQHGIDCPSCAWPDPKHRSRLGEFCENGAKAIAEEATTRRITPVFFQRYSVQELIEKSDFWLGQQGRLTHPMVIRQGETHYEKIAWSEAFQLIGNQLKELASPNEAIFYTSGRTSNEAAFLYQLFVRLYGTNNLPDCSNMCHESSGKALTSTLGLGKGSVTLEDFDKAEVIMILGQNPGTNHPRMMTALEKAKRNGAKIVSVNPLLEPGLLAFKNPQDVKDMILGATKLTDYYLQIKINGDLAFLKCLLKLLYEAEQQNKGQVFDNEFIKNKTAEFDSLISSLNDYSIYELLPHTGLTLEEIQEVANLLIIHKRIIVCWAMGLTQHKNSVVTIREVVNLLLLKGSIGIEGGGTCPVRGHSNVQGDRTMGIHEKPSKSFLKGLSEAIGFNAAQEHGFDTVEAIKAMYEGKAKVFIGMGGNFLSATPDTNYTAEALQRCKLTVHISTKLNRSHLIHGETALILPTLGRTDRDIQESGEQFVSVEDSMGVVHISKGMLKPISEDLLSEPAIVVEMAKATLITKEECTEALPYLTHTWWNRLKGNYDCIRNLIEKSIGGFENYNERIREKNGFYLPNGPREQAFENTGSKKANFTVNKLSYLTTEPSELIMMTIRSHDQFNTTIYGLDDRYRGIYNERRIILMNRTDIENRGLKAYQLINLINNSGGIRRIAERFIIVPYNIPEQCVATYFPETNVLVPIDSVAEESNTPTSKSVIISVEPVLENGKVLMAEVVQEG